MSAAIPLKDRVIVALDVPTVADAETIVAELGDAVGFYKIGMQIQFAQGGTDYAKKLVDRGKKVFFDAKLFDIDETIERASENIARMGVTFLTVHGQHARTVKAAVKGRGSAKLSILAVTVLTSMDAADLAETGISIPVADLVLSRARSTVLAGGDGVIASGVEAASIRAEVPKHFRIVTPGIRRASDTRDDQKRIMGPADAIRAGADHLVIGRPITKAARPRAEAEAILAEIEAALSPC